MDWGSEIIVGAAVFILIAAISPRRAMWLFRRVRRTFRRISFARRTRRERTQPTAIGVLRNVRVIDGDTIEDRTTRIRYRVENIDAPETGDNARCYRERKQGEIATRVARALFERAEQVVARPIDRKDIYGRTVARIELDGQDYGTIMIQRGFARPWNGAREAWCGPEGGLAALARARSAQWNCKKCRNMKRQFDAPDQTVRFVSPEPPPASNVHPGPWRQRAE